MSIVLLVLQCILVAVYYFGDIGFDHPGRFGLDFTHVIIVLVAYIVCLLLGIVFATAEKNWVTGVLQLVIVLSVLGYENRPVPQYKAADYQHLISMPREEVKNMLDSKGAVTGFENDRESASYRGMTIYYSEDGRVVQIVPNER